MKKIVEEWKTVEGYPNYEISNMGRCRTKKSGTIKKVKINRCEKKATVFTYVLSKNGQQAGLSVGKLVAAHFVPNPDGHFFIEYKDGNNGNFNYLNLEWVKNKILRIYSSTKKTIPRSAQIERYREMRDEFDRIIKYLEDDKIGEYINNEVLPAIKNDALIFKGRRYGIIRCEMEEFISYAGACIYDMMSRGYAAYGFKKLTGFMAMRYLREKYRQPETVELNERITQSQE
jgi:hypothetical protein